MEQHLVSSRRFPADEVIQHWLLNTAVEFGVPLTRLFPKKSQGLNVKPIPGCSSEDYARGLVELFDSRMITLSSEFPGDDVTTRSGVSRILDRLLALPKDYQRLRHLRPGDPSSLTVDRNPAMQVDFKLTALGGETWEKVAEPDWGRFISATTTYPDYGKSGPLEGDLISRDRDLLIAYMGWYPEVRNEQIRVETIKWETHTDFKVLYWKRLPFVYHASFEVRTAKDRWNDYKAPPWFWDWWFYTCHWHREPWDLPSWPSLNPEDPARAEL
jgi:hypothetical protein